MENNDNAPVITYSKEQIAAMYKISVRTLCKWLKTHEDGLKELGYRNHCKLVFPRIVRYIFENFGYPDYENYRKLFTNEKKTEK